MSDKEKNSASIESESLHNAQDEAKTADDADKTVIEGEFISQSDDSSDENPYIEKDLSDKQAEIQERLKNSEVDTSAKTPKLIGFTVIIVVFGFLFVWSYFAPLDSAAYAPGKVAVESYTKTIQHLEGGIVKEIHIKEGQSIKKGDLLIVLDDTQLKAQQEIIETQYIATLGLSSRLKAEQTKAEDIAFAQYLLDNQNDSAVNEVVKLEKQIFDSRNTARKGEIDVLKQRIEQLKEQNKGLYAQQKSEKKQIRLFNEEVIEFRDLLKKGFTDKTRMRDMQRRVAELEGQVARYSSDIVAAKIRMGETRLEIIQIDNKHQQEVAELLSKTLVTVNDLKEKRMANQDKLMRTKIVAQDSGIILGMNVHTIGGVIKPGTPILDIVPQGENLIIEARVSPIDIDKVHAGLVSEVRFSSFKSGTTPIVEGRVLTVSADSLIDEVTGMAYFLTRIRVTPDSYKKLGELKLTPGMPADAIIKTGERTVFEYLVQPVSDAIARSFIED